MVILGAERQGTALAAYLANQGVKVKISDLRPAEQFGETRERLADLPIEWHFGEHPMDLLKGADTLFLSGGVSPDIPLAREARRRSIPLSNDSQVLLEEAPCKVIGITGSAGKTTTTILVGRMLRNLEGGTIRRVWVGGNVGNPLIANLDEMQEEDLAVVELSSFQLELMQRSPQVAALLNLAPNHLDRHETMADYAAAKARIFDFQSENDIAVLGREDFGAWNMAGRVKAQIWSFGRQELKEGQVGTFVRGKDLWLRDLEKEHKVLPLSKIDLRGEHNLLNVLAASAIAGAVGAAPEAMRAGVEGFQGVPHRLEWVRNLNGVAWFNDSIATSPQRAAASLRSFQKPVILLLGGRDKGLPWEELVALAKERAKGVVAFGEAAEFIGGLFDNGNGVKSKVIQAEDLQGAVAAAAQAAVEGDVVLLAPGGTSFDEFQDFEARGERFRELVNAL